MDPIADRSGAEAARPDSHHSTIMPDTIDVPGALASQIGNLYADEEIRQRHARTELMIRLAEAHGDA